MSEGKIMYTKLCTRVWVALDNLKRDARGVSAIEYAILAAAIIGVIAVAVTSLDLSGIFGDISDKVKAEVAKP